MKSFIIIGGGASGVITAAQLLRTSPESVVRIFERSGRVGAGIAYSTENPGHLLNVRASNMSAFPDEPDHFLNWLRSNQPVVSGPEWEPHSFAPRMYYRSYLVNLLRLYLNVDKPRLIIDNSEVSDVMLEDGKPLAVTASGDRFPADAVILATGNEPAIATSSKHITEYWSSNGYFDMPSDIPVAIFGTGLSMIDSVLSLLDSGHKGVIHAISRRGLMPAGHAAVTPFPVAADDIPSASGLSGLVRHVREMTDQAAANGSNWRAVIDGLRPFTQSLWGGLPLSQRSSFLRHLRPWWDVHRHRMAPDVAERIAAARASGQLTVTAGNLVSLKDEGNGIVVRYRKRHSNVPEDIRVAAIIDCRGGNPRFSTTRNAVLIGLMEQGLARPDALDLGFAVTGDFRLVNTQGAATEALFAIGPTTRGTFWEVTAVPDIRVQVERLVSVLLAG